MSNPTRICCCIYVRNKTSYIRPIISKVFNQNKTFEPIIVLTWFYWPVILFGLKKLWVKNIWSQKSYLGPKKTTSHKNLGKMKYSLKIFDQKEFLSK